MAAAVPSPTAVRTATPSVGYAKDAKVTTAFCERAIFRRNKKRALD